MPRDGSSVYHIPAGTSGTPDTTVESAKYNTFIYDIESDLNAPRPITAGGTGAASASAALTALGAEKSGQIVTNYDSQPWVAGSFFSAAGATGAPNALHAFIGLAYLSDASNIVIEARDMTDGVKYVRRKVAGTWGSFTIDGSTITAPLTIAPPAANAELVLNKPTALHTARIVGRTNSSDRWYMQLGTGTAESGGNVGSDFQLSAFSDAGAFLNAPLVFARSTGLGTVAADPTAALGIATKQYVDNTINNEIADLAKIGLRNHALAVSAAGGALTIALKDATGNDPTPASPVTGYFRNAAGTGNAALTKLSVTSALSLVVSSGSTLGVAAGTTAFRLWVVLFNDNGTPRLGVVNCAIAGSILSLDERLLRSSTAEGGAGGADIPGVFYTGTAATNQPINIVGSIEWNANGLATPGTWTLTNLSYVQAFGPGIKKPGDIVQIQWFTNAAGQSGLTNTTIATISNTGISISPVSAANQIRYYFTAYVQIIFVAGINTVVTVNAARGTTQVGSQIQGASISGPGGVGWQGGMSFAGYDTPNTVSAITYQLRGFMAGAGANFSVTSVTGSVEEIQT